MQLLLLWLLMLVLLLLLLFEASDVDVDATCNQNRYIVVCKFMDCKKTPDYFCFKTNPRSLTFPAAAFSA